MPDVALPPVTVIIPNYNGRQLLAGNLPAVRAAAARYPGGCTVVVVDDGSADDSVTLLEREFADVKLIRHDRNRGFAEAVHSGVAAADTEHLVFLNSDVRTDADFIEPLLRTLLAEDVFATSPLIVDGHGRMTDESWRGYEVRRRRLRPLKLKGFVPPAPVATLFASGGSMALKKSMFQALGGFLPLYQPFYWEDIDLGMRAWRRGWRSLFVPGCRIVHDHGGSSIKTHIARARIHRIGRRNKFLFEWIHLSPEALRQVIPGYVLQALGRLARLDVVYLGGLFAALRRLPEVRAIRRELERTQALGFEDILAEVRDSLETARRNQQSGRSDNQPGDGISK